jgi:hypothetical protein
VTGHARFSVQKFFMESCLLPFLDRDTLLREVSARLFDLGPVAAGNFIAIFNPVHEGEGNPAPGIDAHTADIILDKPQVDAFAELIKAALFHEALLETVLSACPGHAGLNKKSRVQGCPLVMIPSPAEKWFARAYFFQNKHYRHYCHRTADNTCGDGKVRGGPAVPALRRAGHAPPAVDI